MENLINDNLDQSSSDESDSDSDNEFDNVSDDETEESIISKHYNILFALILNCHDN